VSAIIDTSLLVGGSVEAEVDEDWAVSAVTVGELSAGVLLATEPTRRASRLRRLTAVLQIAPVLPIDAAVASRYGELRAASGRRPTNDLWIAATALAYGFTLVTADQEQASLPLIRSALVAN